MSPFDQEPPKWSLKLLKLYCKPRALEIIEGDAYELFYKRIQEEGINSARRKFSWDVLRFFRLRYIKGLEDFNSLNNISMFKNYFKISVRSLLKQRFYSFINISGLALGLAACLLILLYVSHELSYDKYHNDGDRVYYVANGTSGAWTPARLGIQMKIDFPEVEEIARIQGPFSQTFKVDNQVFKEPRGYNADSAFYHLFTVDFLEGNPAEALTDPNSVVLTQTLADKLFGFESALGKIIEIDGEDVQVTGVVADPPKNTHFRYSYIYSYPNESWVTIGNWTGNNFFTYVKLSPGATPEQVQSKFPEFIREYVGPELIKYSGHSSFDEFLDAGGKKTFSLIPMQELHLHYPHLAKSNGSIDNVYIFSLVALFILLIACINFMNLSTARSAMRSKEVGMRKVLGSMRGQLISQFMVESVLVCLLASILALGIASLSLPGFNQLANREFTYNDLFEATNLAKLFGLMLIVGLLAGAYPAFVLSSFKPIKALKGESQTGGKGNAVLRKGLVAFQFAISIFLIVSTVVVFNQLSFINQQNLGFEPEQVLIIKNADKLAERRESFKNQIERIPSIESIALTNTYVSAGVSDWGYQTLEDNPRSYSFRNMFATADYIKTMGLELVEGRDFNKGLSSETTNIIINEKAKEWLGYDDVLGTKLSRGDGEDYTIIGVVKDFNFTTLKRDIEPFIIRLLNESGATDDGWIAGNYFTLKVTGNYQQTVNQIQDSWVAAVANEPFEYVFLDESFSSLYEEEQRFGKLFTASSGLAIVIACLGLFALAAYTLQKRYKEIAVRKVLGASVKSLTFMVVKSFTILVLIGAVVAIPVGYLTMQTWLSDFAYQISLNNPLLWILPVLGVAAIAWLTVGYQSIRTATSNPIKALRSE